MGHSPSPTPEERFNRRRDACFLATPLTTPLPPRNTRFQSQTRRLLPRNFAIPLLGEWEVEFQSQTRRLLPRNVALLRVTDGVEVVSIADATLASSQPGRPLGVTCASMCFNRRRDACFLATTSSGTSRTISSWFQSQTRRLLPRNSAGT